MSEHTTESEDTDESLLTDLTGLQRDILTAVVGYENGKYDDIHGLGVKKRLQTVHGYSEINHGRLYPNLNALVEKGLIEKDIMSVDNRTNTYTLTERGKRKYRMDVETRRDAAGMG